MKILFILALILSGCTCDCPTPTPSPSVTPTVTPTVTATPTPTPTVTAIPQGKKFPLGVWFQPYSSFDKWKARGINTLFGPELENAPGYESRWFQQGYDKGFNFVSRLDLQPTKKLWPGTIAFMHPDEPDIHGPGGTPLPGDALKANYEASKAVANIPVFTSFAGPRILDSKPEVYAAYAPYLDWFSEDWYLSNRNADRYPVTHKTLAISKAQAAMGGKKQAWSIVEASNQMINCPGGSIPLSRAPTPGEFRNQIFHVILKGNAKGIILFPQRIGNGTCKFGSFGFDAMPEDLVTELASINKILQAHADDLLQDSVQLPEPPGFNIVKKGSKIVILNSQNKEATYEGTKYGPYEVRIQ